MRAARLGRFCVVPALAGLILVLTATPAFAHAILQSTDPPMQGVSATSPAQLSLTFNENVEVSFGSVRLYTCAGKRITVDAPRHAPANGHEVVAGVPGTLAPPPYIVAWRVISGDAHPARANFALSLASCSLGASGS